MKNFTNKEEILKEIEKYYLKGSCYFVFTYKNFEIQIRMNKDHMQNPWRVRRNSHNLSLVKKYSPCMCSSSIPQIPISDYTPDFDFEKDKINYFVHWEVYNMFRLESVLKALSIFLNQVKNTPPSIPID